MRSAERDVMLYILAVSAGAADGWSYFGLGHSFVANMTGNTVLLGIAVFEKGGDLLHPFISLICYAAGVSIAALITRRTPSGTWSRAISWTLLIEACLMAGAEAGWFALHRSTQLPGEPGDLSLKLLLGFVAVAVGLQSGAILQLKIPGIVTTYITGTWTNLMNGLIRFKASKRPRRDQLQKVQYEERLWMQFGILAIYFASAVLTGFLFRYQPQAVGVLPAAAVLFVALYGAVRAQDDGLQG